MTKLAVYDFDGTLINKESVPIILKTYRKMHLNRFTYLRVISFLFFRLIAYKLPFTSYDKAAFRKHAMMKMADLYRGLDTDTQTTLFNAIYHALTPYINEPIKKAIEEDKKNGYHTVLLSGSYWDLLEPFKALGFDSVIGSTLIKNNQVLDYKAITILIDQKKVDKIKALKEHLKVDYIKAIADSYYDIKLLDYADEAIVVNPDDLLKDYAGEHNWTIIDTKN